MSDRIKELLEDPAGNISGVNALIWEEVIELKAKLEAQVEEALPRADQPKENEVTNEPANGDIRKRHDRDEVLLLAVNASTEPFVTHTDRGILLNRLEEAEFKIACIQERQDWGFEWQTTARKAEATIKLQSEAIEAVRELKDKLMIATGDIGSVNTGKHIARRLNEALAKAQPSNNEHNVEGE